MIGIHNQSGSSSASYVRCVILRSNLHMLMKLTTIFAKEPDFEVVGEARNGIEAVRFARELNPDIILMDLLMPKKSGADATMEILTATPSAKVLILTTFGESEEVKRTLDAGASGALIKDTPHTKLVAAIRAIVKGKRVISPEIQQNLTDQSGIPELSARQLEILKFIADGLTTKAISDRLEIGPDGVNAHLRAIFSKLGASSRTEAVAIALRKNLLKL